ncbi:hypothetical protein Glove_50g75 [Diversispora epigaea]|uniref:Protein kinase domain-containing protein n=1 Tax=Diversispora epigaea TaxID=1348612 RepID=A0A397JEM7_9GLOM|nr:hypothetical protein Glove_50g75 [Diversispora epigaea]
MQIKYLASENFKKYGKCKECQQANTGLKWCNSCNSKRFQEEFHKWTSGDKEIDEFIQRIQLMANNHEEVIEWIPFDGLKNITYLTEGGFSSVYKAIWPVGYIDSWNYKEKNWKRESQWEYVCLKILKSLDVFKDTDKRKFLQEIKNQLKFRGKGAIAVYGLTKNPIENEYFIVMKYATYGDLRKMLDNNFEKLSWIQKIRILYYISNGLANIHEAGLMHCDIHPGNIVNVSLTSSYISDFGLCKSLSLVSRNYKKRIYGYGVVPYMATETLSRGEYTRKSDIYSFGMIMLEVFTSYPPYYNIPQDYVNRIMRIYKVLGLRPKIKYKIPQLLKDLMDKCWDIDPFNRPTAKELEVQLEKYVNGDNSELEEQIKEADEVNKNFKPYNPHSNIRYLYSLWGGKVGKGVWPNFWKFLLLILL